jgi:hypothetical protein
MSSWIVSGHGSTTTSIWKTGALQATGLPLPLFVDLTRSSAATLLPHRSRLPPAPAPPLQSFLGSMPQDHSPNQHLVLIRLFLRTVLLQSHPLVLLPRDLLCPRHLTRALLLRLRPSLLLLLHHPQWQRQRLLRLQSQLRRTLLLLLLQQAASANGCTTNIKVAGRGRQQRKRSTCFRQKKPRNIALCLNPTVVLL